MIKDIVVTVPKLSLPGGVSAFWNALVPEFKKIETVRFHTVEIGGHGKNVLGPLIDLWKLRKATKSSSNLIILNPSLGSRSFFRDAFFSKYLIRKNKPFVIFFHGWNLQFQDRIDAKYISFFQKTFGKAKKIFVLSNDFKMKLQEWGYEGEIILATTTVNADLFNETITVKPNIDANKPLKILFLSRLIKEKGIYETISAFEKLIADKINVQLIIAGNGQELEHLTTQVSTNKNIVLTGQVEGQAKIDLYKDCDIYCLPSYSEGLPTSVLEAMAFGKPVITTPVGGLKSFFQNEEMGFFVQPENSIELEEKLRILLVDENLRNKIGAFNYKFAHEHIMSGKVAQKMLNELEPFL